MALPNNLSGLTVREAIQDAIYRAVVGLDTDDEELFRSALAEDAVFDLNGTVTTGYAAIKTGCFDRIVQLDTTHFITNTRVEVREGAAEAKATASALSQHFHKTEGVKSGAPRLLAGALYELDLVRDEREVGLWRIKLWKLRMIWAEGDWSVVQGE